MHTRSLATAFTSRTFEVCKKRKTSTNYYTFCPHLIHQREDFAHMRYVPNSNSCWLIILRYNWASARHFQQFGRDVRNVKNEGKRQRNCRMRTTDKPSTWSSFPLDFRTIFTNQTSLRTRMDELNVSTYNYYINDEKEIILFWILTQSLFLCELLAIRNKNSLSFDFEFTRFYWDDNKCVNSLVVQVRIILVNGAAFYAFWLMLLFSVQCIVHVPKARINPCLVLVQPR